MPFVICFRIDKWTESMLSITSSQECRIVQLVIPIVEFTSLRLLAGIYDNSHTYGQQVSISFVF